METLNGIIKETALKVITGKLNRNNLLTEIEGRAKKSGYTSESIRAYFKSLNYEYRFEDYFDNKRDLSAIANLGYTENEGIDLGRIDKGFGYELIITISLSDGNFSYFVED